jgi:hypothetical protein
MEEQLLRILSGYSDVAITAISIVAVVVSVIGAFKSGALNQVKLGSLEVKGGQVEKNQVDYVIRSIISSVGEEIPFETEQLANYYSQVLAQSKVSFWFSLVFASIGFFIIVLAAFMYSEADTGSTIARFVAGGVVDAVAALFFVQSKRAQESMSEFFDKLRRDRNHVEARKLCESLGSGETQDALRVRLSLHYAEVPSPDDIARSIYTTTLRAHNVGEGA